MAKTYDQINEKIKKGEAVVVTAEEMIDVVAEKGAAKAAEEVDVVTTGTFGPMCSSGAWLNTGHSQPRIKMQKAWLNDVEAYCGGAAVDLFIGATQVPDNDPLNAEHPGKFRYGGGHVIQELIAGEDIRLRATSYGTDCYPRKKLDTWINIADINEAILSNPRNGYQNYNVAVNLSPEKDIYTYLGALKADLGSANYCSAGQLSPLLNDPYYRTIGIGSRIFLGGGTGYVSWQGTQHNPTGGRFDNGITKGGAGTLFVTGDMKQMGPEWVVGVSFLGYGVSLNVGLGCAIPILDEELAQLTAVKDEDIYAPVTDYSRSYPYCEPLDLGFASYAELRTGTVRIKDKDVPTAGLSSYPKAKKIAETLKSWIQAGDFLLAEPAELLPQADSDYACKLMPMRPIEADDAAGE
jgi:uncharacterized protein (DUF39 family)